MGRVCDVRGLRGFIIGRELPGIGGLELPSSYHSCTHTCLCTHIRSHFEFMFPCSCPCDSPILSSDSLERPSRATRVIWAGRFCLEDSAPTMGLGLLHYHYYYSV